MSIDYMVWHTSAPITDEAATRLYNSICRGAEIDLAAHHEVNEFCTEFTTAFPDVSLDHTPAYALVGIHTGHQRFSQIDEWIWKTALAKGLTVFDPQTNHVHRPDVNGSFSRPRPGDTLLGKLLGPILALVLLAASARGAWWLGTDVAMTIDGHSWETASALVDSSVLGLTGSPRVSYSFSIGERVYHGDRIRIPDRKPSSRDAARQIIAAYPTGAEITVYYDPDNPARNVITRPEFKWGYALGMGIGTVLFLLAGCYVLWRSLRRR